MAVAITEVEMMTKRTKSLREMIERPCPMCASVGVRAGMLHDEPKRDHFYCSSCGHVEIDWQPIYRRVERELLDEYRTAKSHLAILPAARATQYDVPYVEGGLTISQQEAHVEREQHDLWVISVIESTFRFSLTQRQKQLVVLRYFERWKWRQVAQKLSTKEEHVAVSTALEWRKDVLKEFARVAKWV